MGYNPLYIRHLADFNILILRTSFATIPVVSSCGGPYSLLNDHMPASDAEG